MFVEEGIETLGYTLILISAIELVLLCRKQLNKQHHHVGNGVTY